MKATNVEQLTITVQRGLKDEVHLLGGNFSAICNMAAKDYVSMMKHAKLMSLQQKLGEQSVQAIVVTP